MADDLEKAGVADPDSDLVLGRADLGQPCCPRPAQPVRGAVLGQFDRGALIAERLPNALSFRGFPCMVAMNVSRAGMTAMQPASAVRSASISAAHAGSPQSTGIATLIDRGYGIKCRAKLIAAAAYDGARLRRGLIDPLRCRR